MFHFTFSLKKTIYMNAHRGVIIRLGVYVIEEFKTRPTPAAVASQFVITFQMGRAALKVGDYISTNTDGHYAVSWSGKCHSTNCLEFGQSDEGRALHKF